MSNLAADKVLRVNCPGFGVSSTLPLGEAKPLAMYDVIVVNPSSIVHLFEPKSDVARQIDKILADGGSTLKLDSDSTLESISAELELREHELRQFLSKGGLLIYFLAAPFIVEGPEQTMDNYIWLYEWAPDKTNGNDRTMAANKGRGLEVITRGKHHPFGPYLQQAGLEWSTVIRTENLSDGYNSIATGGQSKCVAGYKSSGPRRGQVLFLPAPYDTRYDDTLKECIMKWHEIHNGPDADKPEPNYEEEVSVSFDSEPDIEGETLLNDLFSEESSGSKKKASTIDWPEFDNDVPPFSKERMADDLDAKLDALDPKGGKTYSRDDLASSGQQKGLMDPNTLDDELDAQFAQFEAKKPPVEEHVEEPKPRSDDRFEEPIRRNDDRFEEPIKRHDDRFDEPIKRNDDRFEEPIKRNDDRFEEPIRRNEESFEEPIKRNDDRYDEVKRAEERYEEVRARAAEERFEEQVKPRVDDRFEEPIRRNEDRFEEPIKPRAEDRFDEPVRARNEDRFEEPIKARAEERFEEPVRPPEIRQPDRQDRYEHTERETRKPQNDDDFNLDSMLEAKPKRSAEPAPAMEVHAATVSIPEAKDLMSRMEHELSVPGGGAPDWCGKVSFSELQDMQQQLDHLNETVRKAKIKIADIEERIRKLGEIKDALLSANGHKLQNSCSKVFELLGWNTEPSMDESKELFLKDGDKVQAIVRIVYSTGQPNRSELAELSQSVISYWDKTDIEPKGILVASTYADRHPREREEEDFTTSLQEFARRKNLCLINALQLLTMYREIALRDGDANRIRESVLTTNGLINGFRLQFSEPAGARS